MTTFYFHFDADYKTAQQHSHNGKPYYHELDKCVIGPSWCAFNAFADGKSDPKTWQPANYRQYDCPHQIASYSTVSGNVLCHQELRLQRLDGRLGLLPQGDLREHVGNVVL